MITMKVLTIFLVCFLKENVFSLTFPGPRVYVVTPAPKSLQHDPANSAPFYYHNWMRRMDSEESTTSSIPSTTTSKTPDLIFAEFESDGSMKKSIRKLLEKEQILSKTQTTTQQPIYVPEDDPKEVTGVNKYGLPISIEKKNNRTKEQMDSNINYFPMYNKISEPVYLPTMGQPSTTVSSTTFTTTTSSTPINVENIWHIIDNEKLNHYSGNWDEVAVPSNEDIKDNVNSDSSDGIQDSDDKNKDTIFNNSDDEELIDDNFALPGFATNSGNGAENESRAIRTEQNIRFPYVNLKPFQMKNLKKPVLDLMSNNKKGNNLYTNLDNFFEMKTPARGESQDVNTISMNQSVDRYNPAQPYLPQPYGSKSKQSNPISSPSKSTSSLVPPPPPPPTGNSFPSPTSYESFPPYLSSGNDFGAPSPSFPSAPAPPPASAPIPLPPPPSNDVPIDTYSGPGMDDDGSSMDIGYRYKPPSPTSSPQFLPTIAPVSKPIKAYSYEKPSSDTMMTMDHVQDTQGYHYSKPKPSIIDQAPDTYSSPPSYGSIPSYGSSDTAPSYGQSHSGPDHHDSDYSDIIFQNNHGHTDDSSIKDHDTGMMPPDLKPETYGAPPSDLGFPNDFPGDFKFHHDFDDHDHEHHYHHPTSTTEMPRVNRFSYYYLGKKLYYLPLYFSVYFIIYVGALIIKAVLRHKIVYPNSWRPNTTTATFFSKRSVDDYFSHDNMHEMTGRVTHAIATAAEKYMNSKRKLE